MFVGKRRIILSSVAFANTFAWGMYYAFTRRYLATELSSSSSIIFLTGLEWLMTMASLFSGVLESMFGTRNQILLGAVSSLPILFSSRFRDPYLFSIVISLSSFIWALSWPAFLSAALIDVNERLGSAYSILTIATGIGFGLGSLIIGLIYETYGSTIPFVAISLAFAIVFVTGGITYKDNSVKNRRSNGFQYNISDKGILLFLASVSLAVFVRELTLATGSIKLNQSVDELFPGLEKGRRNFLFSLLYGFIGSLITPFARLSSGRLVDRYGDFKVYALSLILYYIMYWGFITTTGAIPIILWWLPIYPFLDTSIYTRAARSTLPENRTAVFGLILFFTSLGGLMLIPYQLVVGSNNIISGALITLALLLSLILAFESRAPYK
ncbi:MFS transporter [Thermogladius sp. 4427co]|uniref:MFS transporter n=1 Tax=Thermogladius sp. 4427co TaxID=3450718 RepID=UPI003F7A4DF7